MSEPYVGQICMFAGDFAPRGWALCQGQLLPIAQNAALFSILGTTYGGNGQTTFALPDLRGRFPVGPGQGPGLSPVVAGEMAGSESVTILSPQMPAHVHAVQATVPVAIPVSNAAGDSKSPSPTHYLSATNDSVAGAEVDIYHEGPSDNTLAPFNVTINTQTTVAGGSQPLPIRNPYLGINFIIALQGVFPTRN